MDAYFSQLLDTWLEDGNSPHWPESALPFVRAARIQDLVALPARVLWTGLLDSYGVRTGSAPLLTSLVESMAREWGLDRGEAHDVASDYAEVVTGIGHEGEARPVYRDAMTELSAAGYRSVLVSEHEGSYLDVTVGALTVYVVLDESDWSQLPTLLVRDARSSPLQRFEMSRTDWQSGGRDLGRLLRAIQQYFSETGGEQS